LGADPHQKLPKLFYVPPVNEIDMFRAIPALFSISGQFGKTTYQRPNAKAKPCSLRARQLNNGPFQKGKERDLPARRGWCFFCPIYRALVFTVTQTAYADQAQVLTDLRFSKCFTWGIKCCSETDVLARKKRNRRAGEGGGRIPDSQSGQRHSSQRAGRSLSLPFWNGPLSSCRARIEHGFAFVYGRW